MTSDKLAFQGATTYGNCFDGKKKKSEQESPWSGTEIAYVIKGFDRLDQ